MKLGEIEKRVTSSKVNQQLKKTFNHEIDFNKLTPSLALDVLEATRKDINTFKLKGENSNTNPKYLNAVLTIEALEKWLTEKKMPTMKQEAKLTPVKGSLTEGEMESAELVLAAKDMVDQLQKMQEQLGELMNENLPPLVDAIRDEMGQDKADSFSNAAKGTLETALGSIESARSGMDGASRVLTGEESGIDLGAEPEGSDAMEPAGDLDLDAVADLDAEEPKMDLDSEEGGTEGEPGLDREER
ncbi:MAG: hypothetical protein CMA64_09450 [Euryarchaeota archaeon]|jgi:hypothetical protein|nr:hypothetical protein [Euryarchaeota archaeon]